MIERDLRFRLLVHSHPRPRSIPTAKVRKRWLVFIPKNDDGTATDKGREDSDDGADGESGWTREVGREAVDEGGG